MRIIFLDVDGVLNSRESWNTTCVGESNKRIDPAMCARLIHLVAETGAKIVVSSTWRLFDEHLLALKRGLYGFGLEMGTIIDETVSDRRGYHGRGEEINDWVTRHEVSAFVILDDDEDMEPHMDHLIKTTWEKGLQDEHCEAAVRLFQTQESGVPDGNV